jgi:hypothetical protein
MKIFQINEETKLPEFTAEARTIEPYKTLFRRLKRSEGDADGRKKFLNEKEGAFIFFTTNYDSNMKYMDEVERTSMLKLRLELPEDWIPDEQVKLCIEALAKDQITASTPIYESALNAGMAIKEWYDSRALDIRQNPQQFKAEFIIDFQKGLQMLDGTLEKIRQAGEKVKSEHESRRTNKGRMISRFEIEGE